MEHYTTIIILAVLLLFPSSLIANSIGKVTYLKGNGILERLEDEYELVDKLSVESNDLIETGKGLTNITFDDNTQVKIKENSKLIIDDFVYEERQ